MEKKKILLIDDEADFTSLIKMRLEHDGNYDVRILPDAKDVVKDVHEFEPDIILLDLLIPGIGGFEICEMLNKDPLGIGIPIIVISGLNKDADKLKAYKCGAADYLVKPLDSKALLRSIEKAIKDKQSTD